MTLNLLKGVSIFLIGMPGTGKTTVGELLAEKLGYRFFDSDVLIERVSGNTVNEIFNTLGEEAFRKIESQVLSELCSYTKSIIATGGGIVIKQMNWSYLRHGLIIWLDSPVDLLIQRLKEDSTRPLLRDVDLEQKLQSLWTQRRPLYKQADLQISITEHQTPEQIVSQILAQIPSILKVNPVVQ
ncbi:shikimate kinase [Gloeothece verrucosa]|uniref:Shikimate kinase n=1 Tax=Gloeothece verrucosa (strain PCC 7822) TaxID=497965 RepID=E0U959_GLOV7|nr:shikimate kinase [Gloeothece verrucosa]ADN17317.1 Shikimate kinase [Gloeothece verrucosa PCC 7822]